MPIRKDKVKWKAENFPAEHEDMEMLDEETGQMKDVVNKDNQRYQFNGTRVCEASGHTGLGFNSTMEAYRGLADWLIAARKDPDFNKGLPSKLSKSKKLHSAEAHKVFMKFTLNLFPAVASPMAYPEGEMPACIREWYESHWERSLSDEDLFIEGVKLMRWFAKPFAEAHFAKDGTEESKKATGRKKTSQRCKGDAPAEGGGDDSDGPDGDKSKRRKVISTRKRGPESGQGQSASKKKNSAVEKEAPKERYANVDTAQLQRRNMENPTQGARPSLQALPGSVRERIYTVREDECGIQDIPSRDELDRHLKMLATEKQIPDVYHLHLVSDWWRAKLRANVGAKMLKRGDWRQLFHKATCECCGENGVDTTKHRGESAVTIYGVEGLMFDYGPEWAEKGEAHPSWLIEEGEAKWIGGEALMIGQFGPYENSASASGEHNNGRTVYAIRLKEIEDCLTTCTQKWHQQRLTRETHLLRRKLNATSTEVHTCGLPDSHIRQWRKVFDAKQKRVMKLEAMNGPTTQRLYQSVTDAYFKHSRDAGEVDTGQEMRSSR